MTANIGGDVAANAWASLWVRGESAALELCTTENGDIGVFDSRHPENGKSLGTGDTVAEALEDAHTRWHGTRTDAECDCVEREEQGDALP